MSTDSSGGAGGGSVGDIQTKDLRIVSYNTANSPQNSSDQNLFSSIFSAIGLETVSGVTREIDLLVIQETDPTSLFLLESALDSLYSQNYSRSIGINSSGDYFGFLYNSDSLSLLETENVSGNYTRDPYRGLFRPTGAATDTADFHVFNVHLNASSASTRQTEANGIRAELNALGNNENYFVIGDLNIDRSTDPHTKYLPGPAPAKCSIQSTRPGIGITIPLLSHFTHKIPQAPWTIVSISNWPTMTFWPQVDLNTFQGPTEHLETMAHIILIRRLPPEVEHPVQSFLRLQTQVITYPW